jgi:hypothetical protein
MVAVTSGCNDPYGSGAKVALDVTDTIHAAADTVHSARISGVISVDEEREAQEYFSVLNKADTAFGGCVKGAHSAGGKAASVIACTNVFSTSISDPTLLAQVHIVNPKTQETVVAVSQTVAGFINGLVIALQNLQAKGK